MKRSLLLTLLLLLFFVGCQKRPTTVLRGGREIPIEVAAKQDYDAAEALFARGRLADAFRQYKAIVDLFDRSAVADNALFRMAQIQLKQNQAPQAVGTLETLVVRYPTGDIAPLAKLQLGTLYHAQKGYKEAAQILSSIAPAAIPDAVRRASLEALTLDSFDKAGLAYDKLRWLVSLYDQKKGTFEEAREVARITPLVEASTSTTDLERLVKERGALYPSAPATYRLAVLYQQAGNPEQARAWAQAYLEKFPNQERYREATALFESLASAPAPVAVGSVADADIGVLLPLSGENKALGDQLWRGLSLALAPYPNVKLHVEDVADNPQAADRAVRKLAAERRVGAIVGPLTARTSQAAASAAMAVEVPIVVWSASEGITRLGENVFRNGLTKSEQAVGLAYLAHEVLGVKRAAILYPENGYGSEFMQMFWKEFVQRGGDVRRIESYDPEETDVVAPVKRLIGGKEQSASPAYELCAPDEARRRAREATAKPCFTTRKFAAPVDFEALFLPDGVKKASEVLPTLAFYDVKGLYVLGTNLWNSELLFRGKNPPSLQGAVFLDGAYSSKDNPVVLQFLDKYRRAYQAEPRLLEAQAYDTGLMLLSILSTARPRSPRDFQSALTRIRDLDGTVGKITITETREAHHKLTPFIVDGTEIKEMR